MIWDMSVCKPIVKCVVFLTSLIIKNKKSAQPFENIYIYIFLIIKFGPFTMGGGLHSSLWTFFFFLFWIMQLLPQCGMGSGEVKKKKKKTSREVKPYI